MVDADILAAIAAGRVPPQITAEYLAQSRDSGPIAGIVVVTIFACIIVCARLYARTYVAWKIGLDDYLIIPTMLLYIAFSILSIYLIKLGSGRHIEYIQHVLSNSEVDLTEVLDFIAHLIYTTTLCVCRLSGLAFYYRLCDNHQTLRMSVILSAIFVCLVYIPQMGLLIFHCRPFVFSWPYEWQDKEENLVCLSWAVVYLTNSSVSLICDLILFIIPSALISVFHGKTEVKLKLTPILFPGIIVMGISIARLYLVFRCLVDIDVSWGYNPMLAVENAEIGGTMIALSVPGLKSLFGSLFERIAYATHSSDSGAKAEYVKLGTLDFEEGRGEIMPLTPKKAPRVMTFGTMPTRKRDAELDEFDYHAYQKDMR